jgi:CRP/FNR family transcriptional regulator, cyclic AMP receptor protein
MKINTAILESQPFLRGMSERQLELIAEESMLAEFKADERILYQGGPANRFYLILEGRVELESPVAGGDGIRIQTLVTGDVLGWSWLFPPYYWHFGARAVTPVKAIFFYGTRLREMCEENHDFGYELMKRVSEIVIKRLQDVRRGLAEHEKNLLLPVLTELNSVRIKIPAGAG